MVRFPSSARSVGQVADAVGAGLATCLGLWVAFGAGDGGGRPAPVLWLLIGLVAAVAAGRALALRRGLVVRMLAVGIAGAATITWPGMLRAGGAPTGYANANAALAALGVVAAIGAARTATVRTDRRGWLGVAGLLGVATVVTGSVAAVLSLLTGFALLVWSGAIRRPGVVIVGGLIAVSATLGVTVAIAVGGDPAGLSEPAGVRAELWSAAADFVDDSPLRGIGPGQFAPSNPVSADPDLRWAHHGYLQAAAELGVVGLTLVLALAGWVWARLWITSGSAAARASLGGTAAVIVGLHATVDYVWHFPAVMIVFALLVGDSTSNAGDRLP